MLNKDRVYRFVIDKVTFRPACVLLQAVYGGDRDVCTVFKEWELAPTPNFVGVKATGAEIMALAEKVNKGEINATRNK